MKIAFLHPENQFTSALFHILQQKLPVHEILSWISGEPAPSKNVDLLVALGKVGSEQLAGLKQLAFIQTASTGYETVDMDAASNLGIWVSFAPSDVTGNAASVAEFAVLLLLAASRRLGQHLKAEHGASVLSPTIDPSLKGKTVLIVGLGGVGEELASRLQPFGMTITATDEHPEHAPSGVSAYKPEKLPEALAQADYVVVCVRASKETENLIDASMLNAMRPGAILVNVARGTLIDEKALLAAVQSGHVSAVGLDVVREEPLQSTNPLLALPQVIVTPHIAGFTDLMLHGTADYLVEVVQEVAAGKKPKSVLNTPAHPRRALQDS